MKPIDPNDYGTGLRNVMELQRQFDELQNILFEHMQRSSILTERERQWAEEQPVLGREELSK